MGAASRVEEAIQSAERQSFDLAAMLRDAVGAYRMTFATHEFALLGADQGAPSMARRIS